MFLISSFFVFQTIIKGAFSEPGSIIPSREEQSNLLASIEEIFKEIKLLVSDEGVATDSALIYDVEKMVDRALDRLSLYEELAISKTICSTPNASEASPLKLLTKKELELKIENIIQEAENELQECFRKASNDIYNNSNLVTTTTRVAMNQGQALLDTLNRCSNKAGLNQISCYKRIITTDVHPLKVILIDAVKKHKRGHMEAISIRNAASECVDGVMDNCRSKIVEIVSRSVR